MPRIRYRNAVITWNHESIEEGMDRIERPEFCSYWVYQIERCPTTGRLHVQGYAEFSRQVSLNDITGWLPGAHVEPRRGSQAQAREYCMKEDSRVEGPWEDGEPNQQGMRADLQAIKLMIDNGACEADIADRYFNTWCRNHNAIRRLIQLKQRPLNQKRTVFVFVGAAGTGKSRTAHEWCPGAFGYVDDPGKEWWDGYDGRQDVIFDEFRGNLPYAKILRVLDRYPLRVPFKGGFQVRNSTTFIFTSRIPVEEWYPAETDLSELRRRIDHYVDFDEEHGFEYWKDAKQQFLDMSNE